MTKRGKIFLAAFAAASLLAGAVGLAACGETEKKPNPAPEDHEHAYGEWEITAPTLSAAGSAKKVCSGCEAGTEGHEISVVLPVLTDESYTKSGDTATCEYGGEATYSVTVNGNTVSFKGATAAKGHAYHEHAAVAETCETDGNKLYYTCDNCTKVFDAEKAECAQNAWVIAKHHVYEEHAAIAETCTTDGNTKYYTCKNCTKVFDENQAECAQDAWVIAKHHVFEEHAATEATCAAAGNKKYYSCENCPKYFDEDKEECEENAWVLPKLSHVYTEWEVEVPTASKPGSAKKTCTKCEASIPGHTVELVLPALTAENIEQQYRVDHTKPATRQESGVDTYTYEEDGESVSFEKSVAFVTPALQIGENTIEITDNDSAIDVYTLSVADTGLRFDFTFKEEEITALGLVTVWADGTVNKEGAHTGGTKIFDSADGRYSVISDITRGTHKLYFSASSKGTFTVTIAQHVLTEEEKKLSPTNHVWLKIPADMQTISLEIGSEVEPGWYALIPKGGDITSSLMGNRRAIVTINGEKLAGVPKGGSRLPIEDGYLQPGRSNVQMPYRHSFTIYAYLKAGDVLTFQDPDGWGYELDYYMEVHEHGDTAVWTVDKKPTESATGRATTGKSECCNSYGIPELIILPVLGDESYVVEGNKYTYTAGSVTIEFTV